MFRKGAIEVIAYLYKNKRAGYYEVYKQDFVASRQSFAMLLKELEDRGIVSRRVIESRPPKVEYALTTKGEEVASTLRRLNEVLT